MKLDGLRNRIDNWIYYEREAIRWTMWSLAGRQPASRRDWLLSCYVLYTDRLPKFMRRWAARAYVGDRE